MDLKTEIAAGDVECLPNLEPAFLSNNRLLLLGSATAMTWAAGVMQICGTGYILPVIQTDLDSSPGEVQWVNNAFNITWGSFALVSGRLSDIYGLRKAYLFGLTCLAAHQRLHASESGGNVANLNVAALSTARALAGMGHALACPAAAGIIGTYFPQGRPRTLAFATLAGCGAIGSGVGWVLSGVLGSVKYSWRVFTVIIIPVMLYPIIVGYLTIPKDEPHPTDRDVDWLGAGLITAAQVVLTLSLSFSVTLHGWSAPAVPTLLAVSAMLFTAFIYWQFRLNKLGRSPLLPSRIFAGNRGQLAAIYLAAVCVWIAVDNLGISGAFYYAEVLQISSWEAGYRVAPSVAAGLCASILVAFTLGYVPARILLVFCISINSLCGIIFAVRSPNTPYWKSDLWAWSFNGFASDGMASIGGILIANFTIKGDQAVANAILLSFGRFGAALGLALMTLLRVEVGRLQPGVEGIDQGLKASFWFGAGSLLCGATIAGLGMRGWAVIGK